MTVQPPDYDALVAQSTDEVERSTGFRAALVLAPVGAAVLGGLLGVRLAHSAIGLLGALAGAALGALAVWAGALMRARSIATTRFFSAWAMQHGFTFDPHPPVYRDTPLLRDGDDQFAHSSFSGTFAGLDGSLYQHTRRVKHTSTDSKGHTTTTNDDTDYVVLRVGFSLPGFRRLELAPRSFGEFRLFDGIESKLTSNRVVELESEELAKEFKLEVDDGVGETVLRALFTPVAIEQVLASRTTPGFQDGVALQLAGSTLVFFRQGSLTPKSIGRAEALVAAASPFVAWLQAFEPHAMAPGAGTDPQ